MIGSGLKKLANQHSMRVSNGVAYGSLMGFATTMCEGSGWKRIDIATRFGSVEQQKAFEAALYAVDTKRQYRVQNLMINQRSINVVFHDTVGTIKKIGAFIAWFYPLLEQYGAHGADICAECGTQITSGNWYTVDGIAYHMHDSCAEHVAQELNTDAQQRRDEDTGSYIGGFIGAFIGAMLGSVVWALVLYAGYVASLVGLVIGWLAEKGYTLLKGKQGKGKIVILIIVIILGVLVGTLLPDVVMLARMIGAGELPGITYGDIPMLIGMIMQEDAEYLRGTLSNAGLGLLFAALGVFALLRKTKREVTDVTIKKMD